MGANRRKPYPQIGVERVKAAKLLEALQNHALRMPDSEMSATQIQAAKILLAKVIPDQKAVEHSGSVEHDINARFIEVTRKAERDG